MYNQLKMKNKAFRTKLLHNSVFTANGNPSVATKLLGFCVEFLIWPLGEHKLNRKGGLCALSVQLEGLTGF